jgi:hypothetical protein
VRSYIDPHKLSSRQPDNDQDIEQVEVDGRDERIIKLGFAVAQSTVMAKKGNPPGQSWGTFMRNHMPHIAAMDLFVWNAGS